MTCRSGSAIVEAAGGKFCDTKGRAGRQSKALVRLRNPAEGQRGWCFSPVDQAAFVRSLSTMRSHSFRRASVRLPISVLMVCVR